MLVNNAGYSQSGAVETVPLDEARRQFETNVFGLGRLIAARPARHAGQGWGRIVNVSSMGGGLTFPGGGWYHASKHAVEALSDALRFEVQGFGIDVVVIQPGLIRTEFADAAVGSIEQEDGPYARFNAAVGAATAGAYENGSAAGSAAGRRRLPRRSSGLCRRSGREPVTGSPRRPALHAPAPARVGPGVGRPRRPHLPAPVAAHRSGTVPGTVPVTNVHQLCVECASISERRLAGAYRGAMPRRPRRELPDGLCHVTSRTVRQFPLFRSERDAIAFLDLLEGQQSRKTSPNGVSWRIA